MCLCHSHSVTCGVRWLAGEKSITRSCVSLERQFCAFSVQLRLPASACRGHREGTGGKWQAVRGLWRLTLVDCKHQFALLGGVSLVWKSFCPLMGTRLAVCASEWEGGPVCAPPPSSQGPSQHHPSPPLRNPHREAATRTCCHKAQLKFLKLWVLFVCLPVDICSLFLVQSVFCVSD